MCTCVSTIIVIVYTCSYIIVCSFNVLCILYYMYYILWDVLYNNMYTHYILCILMGYTCIHDIHVLYTCIHDIHVLYTCIHDIHVYMYT